MDEALTDAKMQDVTLLYVEDEPAIREQMHMVFENRFKQVWMAANGQEGLDRFLEVSPDLVVTDIQMPVMNGLEMIEKIRAADEHVPIAIVTAFSDLENLARAIELSVDGFVKKPTRRAELLTVLRKITRSVIRERELRERDRIIQAVLGWHPFFCILSEKSHIEHVGNNLLQFLGYETKEEFIANHCTVDTVIEGFESSQKPCHCDLAGEALFDFIAQESDKDIIVYLKNKEEENRAYLLKARYFKEIDLYFVAFIDPKEKVCSEQGCELHEWCTLCDFTEGPHGRP